MHAKLRNNTSSSQDGFHVIKGELKARDDSIYKLRQDILSLQEKRDLTLSEVNTEYFIFFKNLYKDKCRKFSCISNLLFKLICEGDNNNYLNIDKHTGCFK